jgi:hypothetical protein
LNGCDTVVRATSLHADARHGETAEAFGEAGHAWHAAVCGEHGRDQYDAVGVLRADEAIDPAVDLRAGVRLVDRAPEDDL